MNERPPPLTDCAPVFGGHRGHPPRMGWLLKVHEALQADPRSFRRPDAPVVFGGGPEMVRAMRFWARAFGLIRETTAGKGISASTPRSHWLFGEEGVDPYLEDPASLWLLHWWLLSARGCLVPTWHYLFAHAGGRRTSREWLRERVIRAAEDTGWHSPSDGAIRRDIACIVAMYGPTQRSDHHSRTAFEESLINPFRDLGLLDVAGPGAGQRGDPTHELIIDRSAGSEAPDAVVTYACLAYAARVAAPGPGSIALSRLANEPGGPGRILLVGAASLRRALGGTAGSHPTLMSVVESGTTEARLAYHASPQHVADAVLATAYQR
jgi:hypothetical protein